MKTETKTETTTKGAQHTPGPWQVRFDAGSVGIYDDAGEFIADTSESGKRDEANARLIAAAPELLEALQVLFAECESRFDYVEATPEEDAAMANARAAIAKATGQE